jgi:hypothetical protein
LDSGAVAEIGGDSVGAHAEIKGSDFGNDRRELGGIAAINDHIGSGAREGDGHGFAEALGGTGDERDFTGEAKFLLKKKRHFKKKGPRKN